MPDIDTNKLPRHIAIIMDGNGRWAASRGLPRSAGHAAGAETFRAIAEYCGELGLESLTVYALSTENLINRPQDEIDAIIELLIKYLNESIEKLLQKNVRLRFIGDLSVFSPRILALIDQTNALSQATTGIRVNICANYGGRAEIIRAARLLAGQVAAGRLAVEDIDEAALSACMYTHPDCDPDLIIRPGAELRLSNFLTWQNVYSELYFSDMLWPDFTRETLDEALAWYAGRKRRFGGLG